MKKRIIKRKAVPLVKDIGLPTDYKIREDGITQSMLSSFPICRQRFLFVVNRWISIDGQKFPVFGNFGHDIMEFAYKRGKSPGSKLLRRWVDKIENEYLEKIEKDNLGMDPEMIAKQADIAEVVFSEYFKYYTDDQTKFKFEAVEGVFDVDFKGFRIRGKKDGKFAFGKKRKLSLMEHKTKGRIETDILEGVLNFDFQNLFYITADDHEAKLKGRIQELNQVLYNIIRNPGYRQNKTETWPQYLERIRNKIQDDPEHFYIRYECPYTEPVKKRFAQELYEKLCEAEAFLEGWLPLYKNEGACKMPFKCQYLDACASGNMVGYIQQPHWFPEL